MATVKALARERLKENIARQTQPNFYVDKLVLRLCWPQIRPWLQLSSLLPYLIRDGLVTNDDSYKLSNNLLTPGEKAQLVYDKVAALGDYACHLLYMAIIEDHSNHLGHDSAREALEEKGVCACVCVCVCMCVCVHVCVCVCVGV